MPSLAAVSGDGVAAGLPPVVLREFEGPLDLLLHLVREHRIDIADIPIAKVTDQFLEYLRAMEALSLDVAGEFFVMAATLLEIKSRALLPRPPRVVTDDGEDGQDPRQALVEQLRDYQRYKSLTGVMAEWEDSRRRILFRDEADYGALFDLPAEFGAGSANALSRALERLLAEAGAAEPEVTSVRPRAKMTLRLAMAALVWRVRASGDEGVLLDDCFARPLVRLDVVMTFLALLELLRNGTLRAVQETLLGEIRLTDGAGRA